MYRLAKAKIDTSHKSENDGRHNRTKKVSVSLFETEIEKLRVKILEEQSLALESALSKMNWTTEISELKTKIDSIQSTLGRFSDDLLTLEADVIENNDEVEAKYKWLMNQQKNDNIYLRNHVHKLLGLEIQD